MQKRMLFERFMYILENDDNYQVDETSFYFIDDPEQKEHMIGCIRKCDRPYWIGYCDIPDGCEFYTALEMLEAKVFNGKSIKERWNEIELITIGAINYNEWLEMYNENVI